MPANVKVVAQAGGAKKWKSDAVPASGTRLEVRDRKLVEVGQAGEEPMGQSETLADFLRFVEQEYPANHTAVVLWDHGGGPLKGACFDEVDSFDALTLPELDEAFAAGVEERGGRPYDLVGFDACLMASLETAVTLEDDASWLVASEELEAGAGWSYPELLTALGRDADAREAGITICDAYQAKSAKRKKDATATLSVVDLSKVGAVEDALNNLNSCWGRYHQNCLCGRDTRSIKPQYLVSSRGGRLWTTRSLRRAKRTWRASALQKRRRRKTRALTDVVMEEVAGGRPGFDHIPPQFSPAAQAAGT